MIKNVIKDYGRDSRKAEIKTEETSLPIEYGEKGESAAIYGWVDIKNKLQERLINIENLAESIDATTALKIKENITDINEFLEMLYKQALAMGKTVPKDWM